MSLNDLTLFDYGLALVILLFAARGIWMGFLRQLATFFAFIGSYWLAGRYSGELLPYVQQITESPKVVFLISFAILLLASAIIFTLIGLLLGKIMEIKLLGWFDRFFLGTLLGLTKGVLVAVVLYMILISFLSPADQFFRDSLTAPYLNKGAATARLLIQDATVRKDFTPIEPTAQEKKVKKSKPEITPSGNNPLSEAEPPETQQENESDNPGNSTEILTR